MKRYLPFLASALLLASCAPSPEPIEYGSDYCHFCKMTIVDRQHGAEAVTDKGKVYKFDAIECMVNYLKQNPDQEWAYLLVNPFENPGDFFPAQEATYLISPNLPSPMGAYLTAFASEAEAQAVQAEKSGDLLGWQDLPERLRTGEAMSTMEE
ncbi:MAG: hypothetical protein D6698_16190 [Gammaproteobacteria bacterium]|nr:MAG: hypothetical protein D6698_16190 [Gammaproteobacteria bacterium]